MLTLAMAAFAHRSSGTRRGSSRFAIMAESVPGNRLAMQALAARFRAHAAETSLEVFRQKFEATADELERLAGVPLTLRANVRKFPDTGNDRGYEH
jgi:hypothetical protein